MAIGINDLDDDDFGMGFEPSGAQQEEQQQEETVVVNNDDNQGNEEDFMSDFLKSKGIEDMNKIKFEDENNQIIERSWNDLSKEEKFNILNTQFNTQETNVEDNYNNELTEDEINFINQLRESNLTPTQYIQSILGETNEGPHYKIDDLSDDEVYLLDLESRVGELSDEEAAQALNNAKQNEDFYNKQVEGIRKEYKEREDLQTQQEEASLEEQRQQAFEEYQAKVVDAINDFNSVGSFDLNFEDTDKEELAQFMLSQDETGVNYLYQALQDPETLTKAAWFILHGDEAFDNINDYFAKQIKQISDTQYKKGLEDGKKGVVSRPTVVIDNNKNKNNNHRSYSSINDLDDDD